MLEVSVFLTILIGLFSLINPLSALPVYLGLTQGFSEENKLSTLKKTCFYILIVCLVSYYMGVYVLHFFGITIPALRVAGGTETGIRVFAAPCARAFASSMTLKIGGRREGRVAAANSEKAK